MYQLPLTGKELEDILIKNKDGLCQCDVQDTTITVSVDFTVVDGSEIKFKSPVNCSQVTNLIVTCTNESNDYTFDFVDANGNDIGVIDNVFDEGAIIKVILDVTNNKAFVQNADTNTYLEGRLAELHGNITTQGQALLDLDANKAPAGYGLGTGATDLDDFNAVKPSGFYYTGESTKNRPNNVNAYSCVIYVQRTTEEFTQVITSVSSNNTVVRSTTDAGKSWRIHRMVTTDMFSYSNGTLSITM